MSSSGPFNHSRRGLPRSLAAALLAACALLGAPSSACADEAQEEALYRSLVQEALREFQNRNWPESRALFRRAHALRPSARTLRGLGMVSYEMRDYAQATRDLGAALASEQRPLTEEQRREVSRLLDRARGFVARYALEVSPADARVSVDGAPLEREPDGRLLLGLGAHTVVATAEGYVPREKRLLVEGGERGTLRLALQPEPVPVPAPAPRTAQAAKETAPPPRPAPAEPPAGLRWTWAALGAAAAFGAASAAVWYTGEAKYDALQRDCQSREGEGREPCTRQNLDSGALELHQLFTNVGLGLTGAAALAAGTLAFFEWPNGQDRQVGVGVGRVHFRGRF